MKSEELYIKLSLFCQLAEEMCSQDAQTLSDVITAFRMVSRHSPLEKQREAVQLSEPLIVDFFKKALEKRRMLS
jgi:hypothetical protein